MLRSTARRCFEGPPEGPVNAPALTSTDASIRFADARAPERATLVELDGFDGPLALLLSLIEARRLDVLTVPLGALAGAYLEALASVPGDRLVHVSAFVAVASQLILIKSRALLPRRWDAVGPGPADEADPEAELRARLLLYRAHRDAGRRLADSAAGRGMFRREPEIAAAAGRAGARPGPLPPMDAARLRIALERATRVVPPPPPPPEIVARTVTIEERMAVVRAAIRGTDRIVLQELLSDVRDRVVKAVTFIALLELAKRRELTVEQDEPWGPIVARPVRPEGGSVTEPESAATEATEAPVEPQPIELTEAMLEALLFVAERPLTRDEIAAVARVDREVVDARLGDLEVTLRDRGIRVATSGDTVELVTAPDAGLLIARYIGADEAPRLTPAALETLAIIVYGQPITRAGIERVRGVDADYALRVLLHRRLIVELGRAESAGRPILYGTGLEFLERFGLVSIEDLPPLEVDVAERLLDGAAPAPDG